MRGLLTGWLPWKARNRLIFCPELVSVCRCRGWVWGWLQEQAEMAWEARLHMRRPPSLPPPSLCPLGQGVLEQSGSHREGTPESGGQT